MVGDTQYGPPVDVWAVGCVVAEMLTGTPLWPGRSDLDQLHLITRTLGDLVPRHREIFEKNLFFKGYKLQVTENKNNLEDKFKSLHPPLTGKELSFLQGCLEMDPTQRLNTDALLKHPYMDLHGKYVQYMGAELRPVPGAGGDGHWITGGTTTTRRKERGPSFAINSKPLGAMGQSFGGVRRKPGLATNTTTTMNTSTIPLTTTSSTTNATMVAVPSQSHPPGQMDTPVRVTGSNTPQNDIGPTGSPQNAHTPVPMGFANNMSRNNWFGSGIVGQGFHHSGLPALTTMPLSQTGYNASGSMPVPSPAGTPSIQPSAQSPVNNSKAGVWKHQKLCQGTTLTGTTLTLNPPTTVNAGGEGPSPSQQNNDQRSTTNGNQLFTLLNYECSSTGRKDVFRRIQRDGPCFAHAHICVTSQKGIYSRTIKAFVYPLLDAPETEHYPPTEPLS
ncbi:unnamed protein product [Echinostoma caproni]|uniref:Protein kinase domain-containing protein n=1 Tax=Echinostoma caproni TaxID=27848 RepID=A0A3P8GWV1_9TREM|nr:unnamed protein product [Echinostoma caproni]